MTTFIHTITLTDSEVIMLEQALQMMIEHCADQMVDGPEAPFWAWQMSAKEVLSRLYGNSVQTSCNNFLDRSK